MPSTRRPQARRSRKSKAEQPKSTSINRARRSRHANKLRSVPVSQLSARGYSVYKRALKVLSLVREGQSLISASRRVGISPSTVLSLLPGDFYRPRGGNRYVPSKSDRHIRLINLILSDGKEHTLRVRGSRQAKLASDYSNAFQRYLAGDTLALRPFRGKTIAGHTLLTDPKKIKELGEKGFEVDHFYAEVVA
jgi:DNA-binding CsgD family transcriptional regulator